MAQTQFVVWEVRPATGSDTNGGSFDPSVASPGTDYSQQGSAQFSGTDLVCVSGADVTSVGHSFASADVGNTIQITAGSGFTAGFYTITSVSGGIATLDRSPGSGTGGTWAEGGALASLVVIYANTTPQGNTIWVTGTLTFTSALALPNGFNNSGDQGPTQILGYGSARGDGTHALFTTSTDSTDLIHLPGAYGYVLKWIDFSNTASTRAYGVYASSSSTSVAFYFEDCTFDGFTYGLQANYNVQWSLDCKLINCEFKNCSSGGIFNSYTMFMFACYIHDCGGPGVEFNNNGTQDNVFEMCVFANNSGPGVYASRDNGAINQSQSRAWCLNCVFCNNTDGLANAQGSSEPAWGVLINCIFYGNSGYGINFNVGTSPIFAPFCRVLNCAFGGNTSGAIHNDPGATGSVTLSANPFTDSSTGDYTLNSTSGGGASCKGAGFQSSLI